MFKSSIRKLLVVSLAAASLTAFSAPVQAAETEDSTPTAQGWCEIVPLVCERACGKKYSARCDSGPNP